MADASGPPAWEEASQCKLCQNKFSALVRRHHCRKCGSSICSDCEAVEKFPIPEFGINEPVKWCKQCAKSLEPQEIKDSAEDAKITSDSSVSHSKSVLELHNLVLEGNKDACVEFLLSGKVNPNEKVKGVTALHCAVFTGETADMIEVLLLSKADLNVTDDDGKTPLHLACYLNYPRKVQTLIDLRADVTVLDSKGKSPLDYLLDPKPPRNEYTREHFKLVEQLIEGKADIHRSSKDYGAFQSCITPIHYAARHGDLQIVKFLTEKKADLFAKDGDGNTPLHEAAGNGKADLVHYLVEAKVNVLAYNWEGKAPTDIAEERGHSKVAEYLVSAKQKFSLPSEVNTNERQTVSKIVEEKFGQFLLAAASASDALAVSALIDQGANVNASENGWTALHHACDKNNSKLALFLLSRHADPNSETSSQLTPLHLAAKHGDSDGELVRILLERRANPDPKPTGKDSDLKTPLLVAMSQNSVSFPTVKLLIESQADVNARGRDGWSTVDLARKFRRAKKHPQVVELLAPFQSPLPTLFDWAKLLVGLILVLWLLSPIVSPSVFRLLVVVFFSVFGFCYWFEFFPQVFLRSAKDKQS